MGQAMLFKMTKGKVNPMIGSAAGVISSAYGPHRLFKKKSKKLNLQQPFYCCMRWDPKCCRFVIGLSRRIAAVLYAILLVNQLIKKIKSGNIKRLDPDSLTPKKRLRRPQTIKYYFLKRNISGCFFGAHVLE